MKAYILLGDGFEEIEAVAPGDILRRGGVDAVYAGVGGTVITGGRGIRIVADIPVENARPERGDIVVIPGGTAGVETLEKSEEVSNLLRYAARSGAALAAICAGPRVLARLGLLDGRVITCYPGMDGEMTGAEKVLNEKTAGDGDLITGQAAGSAIDFGLRILEYLKGAETAGRVRSGIHYG